MSAMNLYSKDVASVGITTKLFGEEKGLLVSGLATPNLWDALRQTNDEDLFPVFYDQLFIIINGYYILRWVRCPFASGRGAGGPCGQTRGRVDSAAGFGGCDGRARGL